MRVESPLGAITQPLHDWLVLHLLALIAPGRVLMNIMRSTACSSKHTDVSWDHRFSSTESTARHSQNTASASIRKTRQVRAAPINTGEDTNTAPTPTEELQREVAEAVVFLSARDTLPLAEIAANWRAVVPTETPTVIGQGNSRESTSATPTLSAGDMQLMPDQIRIVQHATQSLEQTLVFVLAGGGNGKTVLINAMAAHFGKSQMNVGVAAFTHYTDGDFSGNKRSGGFPLLAGIVATMRTLPLPPFTPGEQHIASLGAGVKDWSEEERDMLTASALTPPFSRAVQHVCKRRSSSIVRQRKHILWCHQRNVLRDGLVTLAQCRTSAGSH